MPNQDEKVHIAYIDKDGHEVRYCAILIGEPVPINIEALPRRQIKISNFRQWRDGESEPKS
jgi:hypothetical protein